MEESSDEFDKSVNKQLTLTNIPSKSARPLPPSFVLGAMLSAFAGWFGMVVATDANVRTTQAADTLGLNAALRVAFTGGACMGFVVVGLGLMGLSVMYIIMNTGYSHGNYYWKLESRVMAIKR